MGSEMCIRDRPRSRVKITLLRVVIVSQLSCRVNDVYGQAVAAGDVVVAALYFGFAFSLCTV